MHAWPGLGIVYHPTLAEAGACVMRVITALLIVHQRCGSVLRARAPRANERRARSNARARARAARSSAPPVRAAASTSWRTRMASRWARARVRTRARERKQVARRRRARARKEKGGAPKTRTRPPGVIAEYFPFLVFPYFFTYLAAAVEIVGSFCLAVGIFARPASLLLAGTMMNALAFHLMKFGPQRFPLNPESRGAYTYEPCLAFLGVTLYFAFAGPGKFAMRPHGF